MDIRCNGAGPDLVLHGEGAPHGPPLSFCCHLCSQQVPAPEVCPQGVFLAAVLAASSRGSVRGTEQAPVGPDDLSLLQGSHYRSGLYTTAESHFPTSQEHRDDWIKILR